MSGTFNPPANPTDGQLYTFGGSTWRWQASPAPGAWVNASTGANFVPLTGGTMTGALILSGNAPSTAPLQAVPQQQVATAIAAAPDNIGRNLLHNGLFNVQQRGAGPWTANAAYTVDRWLMFAVTDTVSVSPVVLADADRTAIGDEFAENALQVVFTGSSVANAQTAIGERIEDARRLGGKQTVPSFWARATSGTPRIGFASYQFFGSGGSPSAPVISGFGATPALSSAWTRYIIPAGTIPSTVGKTFGNTIANSYTQYTLVLSDQGNQYGTGIGVQSGTVQFWGAQLELGSVATPLEKLDPRIDLANCQRFYASIPADIAGGYGVAGGTLYLTRFFPVVMRASPTIGGTLLSGGSGYSSPSIAITNGNFATIQANTPATAGWIANVGPLTVTADL